LAESGFAVSPRLADLIAGDADRLRQFSDTEAYFFQDGEPLVEGTWLTNAEYADVMHRMANEGARVIYSGEIAKAIVNTVRGAEKNPGVISLTDLSTYTVKERPAICVPFRGHQVCGMGPPSSGALTVGQILGLLDQFPVGPRGQSAHYEAYG
jgi:gamma-glutamyltranspeptidase/glutathione hydrolase